MLGVVSVLVLLAVASSTVDAGCQFPASLQTNRTSGDGLQTRSWVGRVREQFTEVGVHIDVRGNIIRVTSTDSASWPSYTVVCLQIVSTDRYLVAHEERSQRSARYSCLQFARRSSDVVQIRAAPVSGQMDRSLCHDRQLVTDRWLIFDRSTLGRHQAPCPVHGGYSVHLFDKSRQKGVCDAYRGETRLESECERGDGFVFLFRRTHCIPADMYMYSRQPTRCVASWTDDESGRGYRFTLLRHQDPQYAYYWLLRTPVSGVDAGASFSAVLFKDLVADTTPRVSETRNYIRIDMHPDSEHIPLCSDEYEMCSDSHMAVERRCRQGQAGDRNRTAWHSLALSCPRTCGLCDNESPTSCQLPGSWRGSWTDAATGALVTVNHTAVHITPSTADAEGLTLSCVRWRTDGDPSNEEAMLVTAYGSGCRPRYRCARVLRRSTSLLYLQLSDAASWPLIRSPLDPVDCLSFNYDHWTVTPPAAVGSVSTSAGSRSSTTRGFMLSLVAEDDSASVNCGVPSDVAGVEYIAEIVVDASSRRRCSGTLQDAGSGTLRLSVSGCGTDVQRQFADPEYRCVESSTVPDSQSSVIVTRTGVGPSSRMYCWLFTRVTRRGRRLPSPSFYLLSAEQCHFAVALRSRTFRPPRQLSYIALFSRPLLPSRTDTTPSLFPTTPRSHGSTDPLAPSNWTLNSSERPSTRNVTTAVSELELNSEDLSGSFVNAFVVGVVAVIMAVIETILIFSC